MSMGGGASTSSGRPERYRKEVSKKVTAPAAAESVNPNSKAARESRRLQKLAMGQVDREYENPVEFNKIEEVPWDDTKSTQRPHEPISKYISNPSGQTGPAVVSLLKSLLYFKLYDLDIILSQADWAGRPLNAARPPVRNGPRPPVPRRPGTGSGPSAGFVPQSVQVIMSPSKLPPPVAPSSAPPPGYENLTGSAPGSAATGIRRREQGHRIPDRQDIGVNDDDDDDDYGGDGSVYDWTAESVHSGTAGQVVGDSVARGAAAKELQSMSTRDFQEEDDWPLADFSLHESVPTSKHVLVPLLNIPAPVIRAATPPRVYQRPPGVKISGTPPVNKASSREAEADRITTPSAADGGGGMLSTRALPAAASPLMQGVQGRKVLATAPPTAPRPMGSRPVTAQPPTAAGACFLYFKFY